jgi:hypothetical protein
MTNAVATQSQSRALAVEQVLIGGDLEKLTPDQRVDYYNRVCESVGLNPLTQPFAYIKLNNKLTLYALRACTDQLRSVHGVSVEEMSEGERDGVFIVTAKVRDKEGRTDIAKGAVNIGGLKGEALANALMKAETKAKRRATLSICGLGMLDETEVSDIADARPAPAPRQQATLAPPSPPKPKLQEQESEKPQAAQNDPAMAWVAEQMEVIAQINNTKDLAKWEEKNEKAILKLAGVNKGAHEELLSYVMKQYEWLGGKAAA